MINHGLQLDLMDERLKKVEEEVKRLSAWLQISINRLESKMDNIPDDMPPPRPILTRPRKQ